ncbi:MAG: hypothetical protein PHZ02_09360 [Desulfocapsaceae bacterium]|nr:hypothetical protein [Desulfocapsaceae bacterium]
MKKHQKGIDSLYKKICILKKSQHDDIERYSENENDPRKTAIFVAIDHLSADGVNDDGNKEHQNINAFSPNIKEQAGKKKEKVPPAPRGQEDKEEYTWQEEKKEGDR